MEFKDPGNIINAFNKEITEKVSDEEGERLINLVRTIIYDIQTGNGRGNWKKIGALWEIKPLGRGHPQRIFSFACSNGIYVFVGYDIRKQHERIQGEYRKSLINRGKRFCKELKDEKAEN